VFLDDHVAEIDADAELDPPFHRDIGIALGHLPLHLDRAAHRIYDTRKLRQQAVARILLRCGPCALGYSAQPAPGNAL